MNDFTFPAPVIGCVEDTLDVRAESRRACPEGRRPARGDDVGRPVMNVKVVADNGELCGGTARFVTKEE